MTLALADPRAAIWVTESPADAASFGSACHTSTLPETTLPSLGGVTPKIAPRGRRWITATKPSRGFVKNTEATPTASSSADSHAVPSPATTLDCTTTKPPNSGEPSFRTATTTASPLGLTRPRTAIPPSPDWSAGGRAPPGSAARHRPDRPCRRRRGIDRRADGRRPDRGSDAAGHPCPGRGRARRASGRADLRKPRPAASRPDPHRPLDVRAVTRTPTVARAVVTPAPANRAIDAVQAGDPVSELPRRGPSAGRRRPDRVRADPADHEPPRRAMPERGPRSRRHGAQSQGAHALRSRRGDLPRLHAAPRGRDGQAVAPLSVTMGDPRRGDEAAAGSCRMPLCRPQASAGVVGKSGSPTGKVFAEKIQVSSG